MDEPVKKKYNIALTVLLLIVLSAVIYGYHRFTFWII